MTPGVSGGRAECASTTRRTRPDSVSSATAAGTAADGDPAGGDQAVGRVPGAESASPGVVGLLGFGLPWRRPSGVRGRVGFTRSWSARRGGVGRVPGAVSAALEAAGLFGFGLPGQRRAGTPAVGLHAGMPAVFVPVTGDASYEGLVQFAATWPSRTRCGWSPTATDAVFCPVAKSIAVTWSAPLSEITQLLPSPLTVAQ